MKYCSNCGVILEDDMQTCPLCGDTANTGKVVPDPVPHNGTVPATAPAALNRQQKKLVWEIVFLVLISSIMAALLINFIVNKTISWSEYPVAVCLVILSYALFFAFLPGNNVAGMLGGFITSGVLLLLLDTFTGGLDWSFKIAIPVLLTASLIVAALLAVIRLSPTGGVNLIAYVFIGSALQCVAIEAILSFYHTQKLHLEWSIVVCLCVLLIAIALLFLHFRLKKGRSLEKTFHR
ncbi:DUF6320 domain-containing protein [Chitinophaga polysaccharea]|uniref:DUF6320 domain-containing protein n=1 Tax=Chitinophaga polysaccharea TaxID=1293035 RepID=UPI0011594992|nr:DUF6320 domain-containing protein [Chitinophaga polysaccharea]